MNKLMAIFIVSWNVVRFEPAPCPDYKPDKYTGQYPSMHCAVYHTHRVEEKKSAEFATREEAEKFIKEAPVNSGGFNFLGAMVSDFKIEERL